MKLKVESLKKKSLKTFSFSSVLIKELPCTNTDLNLINPEQSTMNLYCNVWHGILLYFKYCAV